MKTCVFVLLLACGQIPAGKVPDETYVPRVGDRAVMAVADGLGGYRPFVWAARSPASMKDLLEMQPGDRARELKAGSRAANVRPGTEVTVEEIVLIQTMAPDGRVVIPLCKVRTKPPDCMPWYVVCYHVVRLTESSAK